MARKIAKNTNKSKRVDSDYMFYVGEDNNIAVDLYERDDDIISCKITLCDAFVIYGKVVYGTKKGKEYAFISYPSFKNRKGDYINMAYCFNKDIISEINNVLIDYLFED